MCGQDLVKRLPHLISIRSRIGSSNGNSEVIPAEVIRAAHALNGMIGNCRVDRRFWGLKGVDWALGNESEELKEALHRLGESLEES